MKKGIGLESVDAFQFTISQWVIGESVKDFQLEEIISILCKMCEFLKDEETLFSDFYIPLQCKLMATGEKDFIEIQRDAPFNRKGQENFMSLIYAFKSGGKIKLEEKFNELCINGKNDLLTRDIVTISGGNGESKQEAIIINTSDGDLGVAAEYWYLNYAFGSFKMQDRRTIHEDDDSSYDVFAIETSEGTRKVVSFNISEFFGN
jgi:hypothetical protein